LREVEGSWVTSACTGPDGGGIRAGSGLIGEDVAGTTAAGWGMLIEREAGAVHIVNGTFSAKTLIIPPFRNLFAIHLLLCGCSDKPAIETSR
jgi:hypothetical protein